MLTLDAAARNTHNSQADRTIAAMSTIREMLLPPGWTLEDYLNTFPHNP